MGNTFAIHPSEFSLLLYNCAQNPVCLRDDLIKTTAENHDWTRKSRDSIWTIEKRSQLNPSGNLFGMAWLVIPAVYKPWWRFSLLKTVPGFATPTPNQRENQNIWNLPCLQYVSLRKSPWRFRWICPSACRAIQNKIANSRSVTRSAVLKAFLTR